MTLVFLNTLKELAFEAILVDRRFSKQVGEVGRFSLLKVLKSFGLVARLIYAELQYRPRGCILFLTNRPASFVIDWLMTEIMRLSKRTMIFYVHTSGYSELAARHWLFGILVRRVLGAARTTVCLGESLVPDISWASRGNVVVIPNTPYRLPPASLTPPAAGRSLLFLSNLIPDKGAKAFIEAALEICRTDPTATFVIAGDAPDQEVHRELSSLIERSPFKERINLVGKADEDMKWRLLNNSQALVFPSTYAFEAQPLTIVEAMAVGLPVIAYDVGGIRDLVINDETGVLLKANDTEGLRSSMRSILDDNLVRDRLGVNGRNYFDSRFSPQAYKSAWEATLAALP